MFPHIMCLYESIKSHWFDFSSLEKKLLSLRTAGWQPVGLTHISPDNNLVWPSPFGNRHSAFGTSWCSLSLKSISPSLNNNCHNLILASSIYTFQAPGTIFPGPDCLGNDWAPFTTFLNNWTVWAVCPLKCPQINTSLFWLYPFIHLMTVLVLFQLIFLNIRSKVYCISRSFAEQAFSRTPPFIHPQTEWLFVLGLGGGKAWNGEQLVLQ